MASQSSSEGALGECRRCNKAEASLKVRSEAMCGDCACVFIATKSVKRLGILDKETRMAGKPLKRRYLVGLSFGPSSAALVDICDGYITRALSRNREAPVDLHIVHVDTTREAEAAAPESSSVARLLEQWRTRYPRFTFQSVPLVSALELASVDWASLPPLDAGLGPEKQLRQLLESLPSATSRADILRLFIRHLLLAATIQNDCEILLLGCSTTALAELTLAETAKGRGFSLPWQVGDGSVDIADFPSSNVDSSANKKSIPVYYPLRDVFRTELVGYGALTRPPLTELIVSPAKRSASVVSHKDLSIEDVMARYFEEVEENYPSVVANVVRTTAKLERVDEGGRCGVCGNVLDEQGDGRWRGELGEERSEGLDLWPGGKLCYGCERSIHG